MAMSPGEFAAAKALRAAAIETIDELEDCVKSATILSMDQEMELLAVLVRLNEIVTWVKGADAHGNLRNL